MMKFLYYLKINKANTASIAKERLQIIISHERSQRRDNTELLALMQQEILDVIAKYLKTDAESMKQQVKVEMEKRGDSSVLELNITLPEEELALVD